MTGIIEAFRYSLLGKGDFSWISLGYSGLITGVVFLLGILIFNKTERVFVDTV
jgi:lipopolysaccharide transport system permease protein